MVSTGEPAPGNKLSSRRSGGTWCFLPAAQILSGENKRLWVPRSLRPVQGAGACGERKPKRKMRPLTLTPLAKSARSRAPGRSKITQWLPR